MSGDHFSLYVASFFLWYYYVLLLTQILHSFRSSNSVFFLSFTNLLVISLLPLNISEKHRSSIQKMEREKKFSSVFNSVCTCMCVLVFLFLLIKNGFLIFLKIKTILRVFRRVSIVRNFVDIELMSTNIMGIDKANSS